MKKQQNGSVLLASLIIILLFTTIAMVAAKRSRVAEQTTGSNTRYKSVFEAAERSVRDAVAVLNQLKSKAVASDIITVTDANSAISRLTNFPLGEIVNGNIDPTSSETRDAFIWSRFALSRRLGQPDELFNFKNRVDDAFWSAAGIVSQYDSNNEIDPNNNMRNIQTYTFIEQVAKSSNLVGGTSAPSGRTAPTNHFFRITVKASGFPPGTLQASTTGTRPLTPSPRLATENVVVQMIFSTYF